MATNNFQDTRTRGVKDSMGERDSSNGKKDPNEFYSGRESTSSFREGYQGTYVSVMRELVDSARELVKNEVNLLLVEMKQVAQNVGRHSTQMLIFGAVLVLSVLPFLAFLVIGLGELLGDRYWLSSLLVSLLCALIGGPMALRAYRKIKDEDLKMPHAKASLEKEMETVQRKFQDLTTTMKGDHHESH